MLGIRHVGVGVLLGGGGDGETGLGAVVTAQLFARHTGLYFFRRSFSRILSMRLRLAYIGHLPDKIIHIVLDT